METYRITELGKHCGLSRSTLLYYDRVGLLRPSARTHTGYRVYTQADLERLERICCYREAGLSLAEIGLLLDADGSGVPILENRLREIGNGFAELKAQQRLVAGMLRTVSAGPEGSGLDRDLWLSLQRACGLDAAALKRWHFEFERRAPEAHHTFLLGLGLSEKEAIQVRMLTRNLEDNKVTMEYFYELFEQLPRQGPGSSEATLRALGQLKALPARARVLDIGCGCGAQTRILARELKTKVLAIDNHQPVLDRLVAAAAREHLDIEARELSMIDLPFAPESFDLLWAEGSIFIIGLARGLRDFRALLAPGGFLAFSELCWFTDEPPAEAKAYFAELYPDMRTEEELRRLAVASGYQVVGSFRLAEAAWWDDYYTPMLERLEDLRVQNAQVPEAQAVYAACAAEADMFRRHCKSYGYLFCILRKGEQP